ncbi:membrane protein [Ahrensia marina]|uniref:Membrane protein n=2 Tax=Ahrensia marina TaxID=1514904 RepID=A0A0M9GPD3_9HYPH|nr:membrane protein [Ahrensia marina]
MIAFAANSVLARAALLKPAIDPASFTTIRIISGAIMLSLLLLMRQRSSARDLLSGGNWHSAFWLFAYAVTLSFAYIGLDTGVGALILFALVQTTMIGWSVFRGDRPILPEWAGLAIAFSAFVWLVSPGLEAPDPFSAFLMALSGIAWGIYSLRGRGSTDPLRATTGNFLLAVPMTVVISAIYLSQINLSIYGIMLGAASGAITSGVGYAIWYRVLPQLSAMQGSIVQLTVPVIAGLGGLIWSGEPFTTRFVLGSIFILGGVALAIVSKSKRQ